MNEITLQQLFTTLYQTYNLSELRTLAFTLDIPYEDLGGEGKADKIRELVQYAQRHGRYTDLIRHIQTPRPPSPTPPEPAPAPAVQYHFHGPVIGSAFDHSQVHIENISGETIKTTPK